MFSSRLPGSLAWNRISRAVEETRRRGVELLDLTDFNPTTVRIAYPHDAILEALADPRSLIHEPTPKALGPRRQAGRVAAPCAPTRSPPNPASAPPPTGWTPWWGSPPGSASA